MSYVSHANAKLTPAGRLAMVRLVVHDGWAQSRVAERFQCHRATVAKWVARYRAEFPRPAELEPRASADSAGRAGPLAIGGVGHAGHAAVEMVQSEVDAASDSSDG